MPPNERNIAGDGTLVLHDDAPFDLSAPGAQDGQPWRILIADDDVDVHVVTKFALSRTNFQGRRLSFLHAYSAAEAYAVLRDIPDVAMLLLDVIMETPDAGLALVRRVRDELHNDLVRIVLRTGQPGQGLEHGIIVDYDVNDFWCKADLTTRKLYTTVISSLRTYAALAAAATQRKALAEEVARARQLRSLLDRHALVLTLDSAGRIADVNDNLCRLARKTREQLLGDHVQVLQPVPFCAPLADEIVGTLERSGGWAGELHAATDLGEAVVLHCAAQSFKNAEGMTTGYVALATQVSQG